MKRRTQCGRVLAISFFISFTINLLGEDSNDMVRFRFRIQDAVTKVPISGGEISMEFSIPGVEVMARSTNGIAVLAVPAPPSMTLVRVHANDYWDEDVSPKSLKIDFENLIEIKRRAPFRGLAIAPTGRPAHGAKIVAIGKQRGYLALDPNGKLQTSGDFGLETADAAGLFTFGSDVDHESIVIVHPLGIAQKALLGWTNETPVQLRPWTPVKGRMLINNVPAPNEFILVSNVKFPGVASPIPLSRFETKTDAAGNFFFGMLPPGEVTLNWMISMPGGSYPSHSTTFTVDPAFSSDLIYHLRGRAVRGEIVVEGADFDWKASRISASIRSELLPPSEFAPPGAYRSRTVFALTLHDKGAFDGTAVPPGKYILSVIALKDNRTIESINGEIIVPPGEGAIDLGHVTLKRRTR